MSPDGAAAQDARLDFLAIPPCQDRPALGYKSGPHVLVREWLITSLAEWFELSTLDYALIQATPDVDITLADGQLAQAGTAFITRREEKIDFGGTAEELQDVANPDDVTRLIVFDTWVRNWDRYVENRPGEHPAQRINFDNLFLCEAQNTNEFVLKAADFSHCLDRGDEIRRDVRQIKNTKDHTVYGFFPAFRPHWRPQVFDSAMTKLESFRPDVLAMYMAKIPAEWQVTGEVGQAITDFLFERARFMTANMNDTGAWLTR